MKRDVRLHGLSSDHHHALVLARRIREAVRAGHADAALFDAVHEAYTSELRPHFQVEEELLLPALELAGRPDLVRRTLSEHEELHNVLREARGGSVVAALERFASLLERHVRFEERELFVVCEQLLDDAVLGEVAVRAPKRRRDAGVTARGAPGEAD